jgi:PAS domain S-box-containing protein
MDLQSVLNDISAGILITDQDFKIIWANKFEEDDYGMNLDKLLGLWVVDCHKQENREKIKLFLEEFKTGKIKEFTKTAKGMIITYSAYQENEQFAGIVRTRIKLPPKSC